jgi:AcrR family transcriptional regulator
VARPLKRDRRSQVRGAACELFRENGYHATTMDDVAAAVSLNKGTLYHYYDSKSDILFEICLNAADTILGRIRTYPELPPDELISRVIRDSVRHIGTTLVETTVYFQEYPFMQKWFSKAQLAVLREREHDYQMLLTDAIQNGVDQGIFVAVDTRAALEVILGVLTTVHRWYRRGRGPTSTAEAELAAFVLRGLGHADPARVAQPTASKTATS